MVSGLIFNIQRYCVHDGPGIRTTLFFKGCPLDCWWCHNPESKSPEIEIAVRQGRCIGCRQCRQACPHDLAGPCERCGACTAACPTGGRERVGQSMTVAEALAEIGKDRIFHEQSGGGATFSGGEPLLQFDFLCALLQACRDRGIHTALDTCGQAPRDHLLRAAAMTDLVLYDLKLVDEQKHIRYTGVSNARILENLQLLAPRHANLWLRIPIIPGLNDDESDLNALARVSAGLPKLRRISLLPYHSTGSGKLAHVGQLDRLGTVPSPSAERMNQIADGFRALGLDVYVGG